MDNGVKFSGVTSMESLVKTCKRRKPSDLAHLEAVVALLKSWGCVDEVTLGVAWGHDL